jgi:hypothetical protein
MLSFLRRSLPKIDYPGLITKLERNDQQEITSLLYHSTKINYLPITYTLLAKMAKPSASQERLKLFKTISKAKYELAIFEVPWNLSDVKYLPLILDKKAGKIVGIMLPFNELLPVLTNKEQKQVAELGMNWTGFVISLRF